MPPKKTKKVVPSFPKAESAFSYNTGFHSHITKDAPPMFNQVPIPIGANGCLTGINFVVTGTLPSLTREQVKDLIEKYGGKLTSSISGKTDVVIRGVEEVGPKKIQEAQSRGIQITDQEGFLSYIESTNPKFKPVAPAAPPPPPPSTSQVQNQPQEQVKSEQKKAESTESSTESNITSILANLPKPTTSFEYFKGYYQGMGENPPQHNQIPIPTGANQCLKGLVIAATGTMPSLTNDELKDIIEKYGGIMSKTITKKTHILIRGCIDVGEKKMKDAKAKDVPIIDQYGFFEIINRTNPKNIKQQQDTSVLESTDFVEENLTTPYSNSLFSEKYRPRSMKEVVGNIGAINQLRTWINSFIKTNSSSEETAKSSSQPVQPIAVVSGPTGIGKTTAVHLVCNEYGFTISEFNASDSLSKKFFESIKESTNNLSLNESDTNAFNVRKHAIIFEGIEDMSRYFSNLIELAKSSKIPIICICNSIENEKLDTLLKSSLKVRFNYPKPDEIKGRLRYICNREKINNISDSDLDEIIAVTKRDVRFAINSIQYWGNWTDQSKASAIKDESISNIIQAALTILTKSSEKTLDEKIEGFFYDYSQVPLYIQQNLPLPDISNNQKYTKEDRNDYADALESICYGDMIDNCIRQNQSYELLNAQAITSSILPSELVHANVISLIIPKFYGATKKQQKYQRYINEIGGRAATYCSQPKAEIYDTFSSLLSLEANTILSSGKNSNSSFLSFIDSLGLTIDDIEHANEIITFERKKEKAKGKDKKSNLEEYMKELTKEYKTRHSDDPKKISSENDFRALHNIRQTKGKTKSIK